jgi:flotillin
MGNIILVGAVSIIGALVVIGIIISRIIYICPPNEVLLFSGGHRKLEADRTIGYRVVQAVVAYDPADQIVIAWTSRTCSSPPVQGAYSRAASTQRAGVANVKVSAKTSSSRTIRRFLG